MEWSFYQDKKILAPKVFSNGKSQKNIVEEILKAIKDGEKIIFLKGMCGTGKSAIALNIAKELGKTSIIVPSKALQEQYKKDYKSKKYILKSNGEKLKISILTGRKNHPCLFLEENRHELPKKEVNSKLQDIFQIIKKGSDMNLGNDSSANNSSIPCKIELKEKNIRRIKDYLRRNSHLKNKNIELKDIRRISVARACPYWSAVLPEKYELKNFDKEKIKSYMGLNGTKFNIYQGKKGCGFYEQFNSYVDSDVLIFNSLKYKLESAINRKPQTEVEIIDECDEFLDSFSEHINININKLQNSLAYIPLEEESLGRNIKELEFVLNDLKLDRKINESVYSNKIFLLEESPIKKFIDFLISSSDVFSGVDEESYLFQTIEQIKMFEELLKETYVTFTKKDGSIIINLVTVNLKKRFQEIVEKNKSLVLMSGTIHSSEILKNIFGIENFKIIEAETEQQGEINIIRTGLEIDCRYSNFYSGNVTREDYLLSLNACLKKATKPTLIHINSFKDLPTEEEINKLELRGLVNMEELKDMQRENGGEQLVEDFKDGAIDVLFSTKCSRGVDFPGEQCRSIIFTKYPNPNIKDSFWKILKETNQINYWSFYRDKAKRELLQRIYRGLRFKEDVVEVLSPDSRVLDFFNRKQIKN